MTSSDRITHAARRLLDARATRTRIASLPADAVPRNPDEAYAIQDAIVAATGPIAAWKVGAKSPQDEPQCAPICAAWLHRSPARFAAGAFALNGLEGELAFTLACDLPRRDAPYTATELATRIASMHPVIEVVDSRFVDFQAVDALSRLADFVSHGALVVGPGVPLPPRFDVGTQAVELDIDGRATLRDRGSNPAGDPFRLLAWLADHAAVRCGGLRRGTIVTTGSWTGLAIAPPGARVTARFPGVGEARITGSDFTSAGSAV
jgi:2-keto-4-pentenoate hydratase